MGSCGRPGSQRCCAACWEACDCGRRYGCCPAGWPRRRRAGPESCSCLCQHVPRGDRHAALSDTHRASSPGSIPTRFPGVMQAEIVLAELSHRRRAGMTVAAPYGGGKTGAGIGSVGVLALLPCAVAPIPRRLGAGARHVFPLYFAEQPVMVAGAPCQPLYVGPRVVPVDTHDRVAVRLVEARVAPRVAPALHSLPAARTCIVVLYVAGIGHGILRGVHEAGELAPRHLVHPHREVRSDAPAVLRPLVVVPLAVARQQALASGTMVAWSNPDSGNSGQVTPKRAFTSDGASYWE